MSLIRITSITLVVAVVVAMPLSLAGADPLFGEDFESYAEGSNISGQGGWVGDEIRVGVGSGLGSKVLNGRIVVAPPASGTSTTTNRFAPTGLTTTHVYVLSFDGYAYAAYESQLPSYNAGVYFHQSLAEPPTPGADSQLSVGWYVGQGWVFDARALTGDPMALEAFHGPPDWPATLQVVLDPYEGKAWGVVDLGGGIETTHQYSFTASQIARIDGVCVLQDFRQPAYYLGAEFDNILVFEDPGVATMKCDWGTIKRLYQR